MVHLDLTYLSNTHGFLSFSTSCALSATRPPGIISGTTILHEEGTVFIGVDRNRLNASMALFVNEAVGAYTLNQLTDPGCLRCARVSQR